MSASLTNLDQFTLLVLYSEATERAGASTLAEFVAWMNQDVIQAIHVWLAHRALIGGVASTPEELHAELQRLCAGAVPLTATTAEVIDGRT